MITSPVSYIMILSWLLITSLASSMISAAEDADLFLTWFDDQHQEIFGSSSAIISITGNIPSYVNGNLIRLGPSILRTPSQNYTNFLDGFGRISKWEISSATSSIRFQSAMIRSNLWNASSNGNVIPPHITQEKLEPSNLNVAELQFMDNTDVNVYKFKGSDKLLTLTDFYLANIVDLGSLNTIGNINYQDTVDATWSSSHPAEYFDRSISKPVLVNWIGQKTLSGAKLSVYKMGEDLVRHVVGSVDIDFVPYSIHSISVAGDYAIVVLGPVGLNFLRAGISKCIACAIEDNLSSEPTQLFVFSLLSSLGQSSNTQPKSIIRLKPPDNFFMFHQLNARIDENATTVALDMCVYTSMDGVLGRFVLGDLKDIKSKAIRDNMPSFCNQLRRVNIDMEHGQMISYNDFPIIDAVGVSYTVELASINSLYVGKPYCFVYALTHHIHGSHRYEDIGLLKIDICENNHSGNYTVVGFYNQSDIYLGEPIFVPNPKGTREDDGVILVISKNGNDATSKLLVLDAIDMTLVASAQAPFPLGFEFHGQFFPTDNIMYSS